MRQRTDRDARLQQHVTTVPALDVATKATMPKIKYIPCALLALSQGVYAQQPPTAGSQMLNMPATQIPQPSAPPIEVMQDSPAPVQDADSVRVLVRTLRVTGAQAYSEETLLGVTGFRPGSELTLTELRAMAARITEFYRQNGYFVAQAYLPAQEAHNGELTIAVLEGHYGKVILRNQTNLSDGLAGSLLDGVQSGDVVTTQPLESSLLLLSDLPGVQVKSTLVPGVALGTSDLIVDVTPGQRVTGSIDADNAGNRYTGAYRLGATVNLNNPTGHGDVATLRAVTSGSGLHYVRGSYQMQFGKARVGVAYSHLGYELGKEFSSLDAHGTAKIASLYGSYPLIRSRNSNLYAGLGFDAKSFQDRVDSTASVTDKRSQVLTASLYGNHSDSVGRGGLSVYSLALSSGNLDIRTPVVRTFDAMTAQTHGHFNKLAVHVARLQNLSDSFSLYASINGQVASKNLDVSEKMELGGMYAVRAYPEGEAYADEGYVLTLEGRMLLPKLHERQAGQMHFIVFADTGTVTANKNPWAPGTNRRTLSGAGVGLNWTVANDFVVKAYYAHKLGNSAATSAPDRSGRFWIQAVKHF